LKLNAPLDLLAVIRGGLILERGRNGRGRKIKKRKGRGGKKDQRGGEK